MADGLAAKQNTIVDDALEIRHVRLLQDSLDAKQSLLSDVPGTGINLRFGTQLRKVYGHGGIAVTHSLNPQNINDPINFQVRISGEQLQPIIATESPPSLALVDGLVDALSTASASAVIQDGSLSIAKTEGLQAALDSKQVALSDVVGTGVSVRHGTDQLRKLFGHGGIEVTTGFNVLDATDPENFQVQISGANLQTQISSLSAAIADAGGTTIGASTQLAVLRWPVSHARETSQRATSRH